VLAWSIPFTTGLVMHVNQMAREGSGGIYN
jgi:hypothetical protein